MNTFIGTWLVTHIDLLVYMGVDELMDAAHTAYRRHLNPPVCDAYAYWMTDTALALSIRRARVRVGGRK